MKETAIRIRPYAPKDASALSALYVRSVRGIGAAFYTPAQIEAWASIAPDAEQINARRMDGRATLLAVDANDAPLAFADVEADGHIDYFYCAPEAAGAGVASALYDALEALAAERNIERLYCEASEAARRFFTRKKFTETARRDFEVAGVAIHNYAMEKAL